MTTTFSPQLLNEAYVYGSLRTPFGKIGGALAGVRPDDLMAHVIRELVERAPGLNSDGSSVAGAETDTAATELTGIDNVVVGNANGAGEENRNVARMASLLAGLDVSVPGTTLNRLCGSSLEAAAVASREVNTQDADIVLVGGVESMSRAPWAVAKPERAYPTGELSSANTTLGWRFVNPAMPPEWTVSLGEATEQLREKYGVSRTRQDEFASRSQELAATAWAQGRYDSLVTVPSGITLQRDESIRDGSTPERLAKLNPVFRPDGTVTAGNASPMSDGAAAVWVGSAAAQNLLGLEPIARIAGRGTSGNDPRYFGAAPVTAANMALTRAGISWKEVGAVELNEAFAVQSLVCIDEWGIDPEIVNTWGGALALGHPLGASGARVLGTLAARMAAQGSKWGVAALCIGVGQGVAVVVENVNA